MHGDICGPIKPATLFLLLVDDKSRFMWLILLQMKSEAVEAIKRIQAQADAEGEKKMRKLQFTTVSFGKYCDKLGTQRQFTTPYSSQQNGVVECQNQTIADDALDALEGKVHVLLAVRRQGRRAL